MIDSASSVLPFGPLEVEEVFSFYEIPRFYSMRSTLYPDIRVLALCIEDDDDGARARFLYAAMSADRYRMVRSGGLPLIDAFQGSQEGQLWQIDQAFSAGTPSSTGKTLDPSVVSMSDLPSPDVRLDLETPTAEEFVPDRDVIRRSVDLQRSVAAIELHAANHQRTEFPLKWLGQIQVKLQDVLNAIGQELSGAPTAMGRLPDSIQDEMAMSVIPQILAASYVMLIAPDLEKSGSYMESPRVHDALTQFVDLVRACGETETSSILTVMMKHGPRARGRFRELLEATEGGGSSFGVYASRPQGLGMIQAHLTSTQIRGARALLADLEKRDREVLIERGVLVAFNAVTGAFTLIDAATAKLYKGTSSAAVREKWSGRVTVGTGSFFVASILASRPESDFDVERDTFVLLTLEETQPDEPHEAPSDHDR